MRQFRESRYWVSKGGEVTRCYPERYVKNGILPKNGEQKYLFRPEKWVKVGALDRDGYQIVDVCINGKKQGFKSHRMVAELYCSGYFEGAHVDHIDNNPLNNHYTNLQWCSSEYNRIKHDKLTFPLYSEWSK